MATNNRKIKEIISKELNVSLLDIKDSSHLQNDLGMDSLDAVCIVMEIETQFNIQIPDEQIEKITTVQSIVELVNELV